MRTRSLQQLVEFVLVRQLRVAATRRLELDRDLLVVGDVGAWQGARGQYWYAQE